MIPISLALLLSPFYFTISTGQLSDLFDDTEGSLVLSSVDDQIKSAVGEFDTPWPGFTPFIRDPRRPLYGLTYFPWRSTVGCSSISEIDIENDIKMISQVATSVYIYELYCDFGPVLVNLTRQYEMTILLGISARNDFERQRDQLERIFHSPYANLSHVVAVSVGHSQMTSIFKGPTDQSVEMEKLQEKLRNVTEIVRSSSYPDIPISTADSIDYIFNDGIYEQEQIYIGTFNTMKHKPTPSLSTMYLYEGVLEIRKKAEEVDANSTSKPIILTDLGWASEGVFNFTSEQEWQNQTHSSVKPDDQKLFLYYLHCPKYPVPPMYYVHSAFDLTWKYRSANNSAVYWGLADAVTRKWKTGILSALLRPCLDTTPKFDEKEPEGGEASQTSPTLIAAFTGLGVLFLAMCSLVIWFWRRKKDATNKLKRSRQQQLELMRNISNASTGEDGHQNRYLRDIYKQNSRWDDYLNTLEPEYEDLSHLVAPALRIDLSRLELKEIIGEGHFGIVQKARYVYYDNQNGIDVAVKRLHVGARNVNQFLQEGIKMQRFDHPNVLNLIGISFTPTNLPLIITPYLEEGDVLNYVKKKKNTSLSQLLRFCAQIAEGMKYLHALKVIHRDLAARNCMLDKSLTVKIADFGLCRDISDQDSYQTTKAFELPIRWMPPEAIENLKWTIKSDVWSYGVVMWEILSRGKQPYSDVPLLELRMYLKNGGRLEKPEACPDIVYEIMKSCLSIPVDSRPVFAELCQCLPILLEAVEKGDSLKDTVYYTSLMPAISQRPSHTVPDQSHTVNTPIATVEELPKSRRTGLFAAMRLSVRRRFPGVLKESVEEQRRSSVC